MESKFLYETSTSIPNALLDRWLHTLSGDELKVMLYIVRHSDRIIGQESDLEISEIGSATGLRRPTVVRALKLLVAATGHASRFRINRSVDAGPRDNESAH